MDNLKLTRKKAMNDKMVKRLKFDFEDQQRTDSTSNTTILDVNDDCLCEIFRLLNIKDLMNVRAATSRFNESTEMAYLHNQRVTPMVVSNGTNLQLSVDILKQFGHLVKKMCVNFKMDKFEILMQAMVKYCGANVMELEFDHVEEEWYFGLHRTGVRRVQRQLRELRTKFPKLQSLRFEYNDWVGCPYSDDIIQAIPTLTAFSVNGIIFTHEDVLQFISLNSQLERLQFWVPNGFVTQTFIDKLDASLPQLKLLELNRVTIEGPLKDSTMHSTRFKNLRKLIFGRVSTPYSVAGLISLFGTDVEELKLFSESYFIPNFVESVSQFKNLSKLTINLVKYLEMDLTVSPSDAFDMSIVSPNAIKEIILNTQLRKVKVNWGHQMVNFHVHENKYRKIFEQKLNGAQWLVHVREWCENTQSMRVTFEVQKRF